MSLYSKNAKIDGLEFGLVMRGTDNGQYMIVFERECATLEQIEAINWEHPTLEGNCILPAGYGFEVEGVTYSSSDKSYRVTVQVARQFLGDVTGYQAQIDELREEKQTLVKQNTAKQAQIDELEEALGEADEALIAMYEQKAAQAPDAMEKEPVRSPETAEEKEGEEVQE